MRQTNNALTFLSASYQAVFKHAYYAGLASSAVMLTLASPYAIAAVDANFDDTSADTLQPELSPFAPLANTDSSLTSGDVFTVTSGTVAVSGSNKYQFNGIEINVAPPTEEETPYPRTEGLTVNIGSGDTTFYAKNALIINNGYLNASGSDTHLLVIKGSDGASGSSGAIVGNLTTDTASMDIDKAIVHVKTADIYNSYIELAGMPGFYNNSNTALADLAVSYSGIKTEGDLSINRSNVFIGDHAAIDALGKLSSTAQIGERTTIDFTGSVKTDALNIQHGETFATSQLRADHAVLNDVDLKVGQNATAGIYANALELTGANLTINSGSKAQIASRYENTFNSNDTLVATGAVLTQNNWIDTTFASGGTLKITSTNISNSGDLILGAASVDWDKNTGNPANITTVDYTIDYSGGTFVNSSGGNLHIGADVGSIKNDINTNGNQVGTVDQSNGTTLNFQKGSFINEGNLLIHTGSNLKVTGDYFEDSGSITIESGASLAVVGNAILVSKSPNKIQIDSGAVMTIGAGALSKQSGDVYYSAYDHANLMAADLSTLKFTDNSGSIVLTEGIFTASGSEADSFGDKLVKALNSGTDTGFGQLYINDATLMLADNLNLDIESYDLSKSKISGSGNSTLYTQGTLTFTAKATGDNLNGFTTLMGRDVVLKNNTNEAQVQLVSTTGQRIIAATNSVSTASNQTLNLSNFTLQLTDEQLLAKQGTTPSTSSTTKSLNANVTLDSGGTLEVLAGDWTAKKVSTKYNSGSLHINGSTLDANGNTFSTGAKLTAESVALNGKDQALIENSGALTTKTLSLHSNSGLNLRQNATLVVTDSVTQGGTGSLSASQNSNVSILGNVTLQGDYEQSFELLAGSSGSVGALNVNKKGKVRVSQSNLNVTGNLVLSGSDANNSPTLSLESAQLSVGSISVSSGNVGGFNTSITSTGSINLSGSTLALDNSITQDFNLDGDFNLRESSNASISGVNASMNKLSINTNDKDNNGLILNESSLTTTTNIDLNKGFLKILNSSDKLLKIGGNLNVGDNSQAYIDHTSGEIANNIEIAGTSNLNLLNSDLTVKGSILNSGNALFNNTKLLLDGSSSVFEASGSSSFNLINGELQAPNIKLSDSSTLTTDNSSITTNTLHGSSGNIAFNNGSKITINGDGNSGSIDISGNITLNASELDLGNALDTVALTYDDTNGLKLGDGFKPIHTTLGSIVYLNLSQLDLEVRNNLTLTEASKLAKDLITGTGLVNFEGSISPLIDSTCNEYRCEVDYGLFDNLDLNFSTDTTRSSVLVNVDGPVAGEWAAIETDTDKSIQVNSTLSILGTAGKGNDNLAQDEAGHTVDVVLASGSALHLKHNGNIGNIIDENLSANLSISGADTINIKPADDSARSKIQVGTLLSDALINVQDVTTNTATFNSGAGLNSDVVKINETLTALNSSFIANTSIDAGSINSQSSSFKTQTLTAASFSGDSNTIEATNINFGTAVFSNDTLNAIEKFMASGNVSAKNTTLSAAEIELLGQSDFTDSTITAENFSGASLNLYGTNLTASGDIIATGKVQVLKGSVVTAQNIKLGSGGMVVGAEDTAMADTSSTGKVVTTNLDLNGNTLILDPEFGQAAATLFANNIGDLSNINDGRYDTNINGDIIIGRNSALGLGGTEEEFNKDLASYQDATTKSLDPTNSKGIGALLYINRANIKLNENQIIIGTEDVANLKDKLTNQEPSIYLGQKSGIHITAKALNEAQSTTDGLIFSDLDNQDIIESTDGTLFLPSGIDKSDLASIFGEQVQLASGSTIKVQTENGLFHGVIDSEEDLYGKGDFTFDIDDNARLILKDVSNPTFNYYLNAMGQGSAQPATLATAAETTDKSGAGYLFLSQAGSETSGKAIEQSARLASFGMGVQVANQAAQTTADAIDKRLSMGIVTPAVANSKLITNASSALWFTPTYQKYDSSNFGADNLSYGADVDLYGIVMGFDHEVSKGFKVGAAVNLGSGDASGKGIASGVSNDFDYYGLGVYGSYQLMPKLTLSADASYTVVDSELETNANVTGYNKIGASTDSEAFTVGVTARYDLNLNGFNVSPHAGARYTRIDMDSYDFNVDGQRIGHTDVDNAQVLSIPVGVSLSKDFKANDWLVQPYADFTVTANIGGDSIGSESTFDGAIGSAKYNTEFMDKFHYGIDAGIQLSKDSFTFGANVGYTGSSNTKELTVGANVELKF